MTAATCLIRVLVLLSAVTVCSGSSTPSGAAQGTEAPASTARLTTPDVFTAAQTTTNAPQPQTTITTTPQKTTVAVTPTSASTQTPTLSTNTKTEQTPEEETVSLSATSISTDVTSTTTTNTTDSALSQDWEKSDLEANPGLVAVICIFCVIFALMIVVAALKFIRSPRSNFERLEDMPLGKVNEESPFAQHSK